MLRCESLLDQYICPSSLNRWADNRMKGTAKPWWRSLPNCRSSITFTLFLTASVLIYWWVNGTLECKKGIDAKILDALLAANVKALELQSLPGWETELWSAVWSLSEQGSLATRQMWDKPWLHTCSEGHGGAGADSAELLLVHSSHFLPQVPEQCTSTWLTVLPPMASQEDRTQDKGENFKLVFTQQ